MKSYIELVKNYNKINFAAVGFEPRLRRLDLKSSALDQLANGRVICCIASKGFEPSTSAL